MEEERYSRKGRGHEKARGGMEYEPSSQHIHVNVITNPLFCVPTRKR